MDNETILSITTTPNVTANETVIIFASKQRTTAVEAIFALGSAILFIILTLVVLLYRSKRRYRRLNEVRKRARLDVQRYMANAERDPRKHIIEESLALVKYKIVHPPQYDRVIPSIVCDKQDEQALAREMLHAARAAFPSRFGDTRLLTMRGVVSCLQGLLDPLEAERFVRIYESILFGVHMGDGTEGDVTKQDLKFMHSYFQNTIMKELHV